LGTAVGVAAPPQAVTSEMAAITATVCQIRIMLTRRSSELGRYLFTGTISVGGADAG
jgi:hypothetical protein